jgi:hypothetical protein
MGKKPKMTVRDFMLKNHIHILEMERPVVEKIRLPDDPSIWKENEYGEDTYYRVHIKDKSNSESLSWGQLGKLLMELQKISDSEASV